MATKVDELIVEIKAETRGLRKGLDQVNSKLKVANKTASASVMQFGNLAKIFATIGFARIASSVVDTIRTFEDLEATLQANTGNAKETAEALDMIKEFTATTTFQIEEVTSAFIEFRRLGIKATKEDLRGIGNVAAAQGVGIDQIAQAVFKAGTTSIESLQMLGFEGKTEGDKITLTFGDITETVDKSAEGVLKFVRSVGELKVEDAITQRANTLTGAISNLGDASSLFMDAIGGDGADGNLKSLLIDATRAMSEFLMESRDTAATIGIVLTNSLTFVKELLQDVRDFTQEFAFEQDNAEGSTTDFAATLATLTTILITYKAIVMGAAMATAILNRVIRLSPIVKSGSAVKSILTMAGVLDELSNETDDLMSKFTELSGFDDLQQFFKDLTIQIEPTEEQLKALAEAKKQADDSFANKKLDSHIQTTAEVMLQLSEIMATTSNRFTNDFVKALVDGQDALSSFKDFSKNLVSQIISTFLQLTVVNHIMNAIFGNVTGFEKLPTATAGQFFGRGSAGGGTVQANRPVLVGERGAEIFVPNTSGSIMNHADSKGVGGGGLVVNQQISFSTGVVPTVRAEVSKMLPQIADVTKFAVLEAAQRGGSFRKGLQGA